MKKASKSAKIIVSFALIMLAFLCSLNVTYSYFTASAKESGTLNFSDVDVRFVYNTSYPEDYETNSSYTINLYPTSGSIARGAEFELSDAEAGEAIHSLEIKRMPNTADAYVRFWIDAYVYNSETQQIDKSVNYGKFFFIDINEEIEQYVTRGNSAGENDTEGDWCYYLIYPLMSSSLSLDIGNSLIFQDVKNEQGTVVEAIPNEVLGTKLKITMTVEAVQYAHKAFESEFNDEKGYYVGWN